MIRRLMGAALLTASVALAGVACGGDDDDDANTTPEPTTAAASATAQRTATRAPATTTAAQDFSALTKTYPAELIDGMFLGKKDAKVTVAVYEDFQCPFCLKYTLGLEQTFVTEYVLTGKVRLEFKNFPILGPESVEAGIGAACMAEQNKFWPYHHRLFLEQAKAGQLEDERLNAGRFSEEKLTAYAVEAGADKDAFVACFSAEASFVKLTAAAREASSLGIRSTPTWVVGATVVSGGPNGVAAMRKLLDDALAAAK
ncbi:MAG: DsbA family protein [Dehalococcoidia bacterium]